MHHVGAVHLVAAAGQRDPELLPDLDEVNVGDVVGGGDLLVGDEGVEHVPRDVVEAVHRLHDVDGAADGLADAVSPAAAAEGDADDGLRGDGRGTVLIVIGRRQAVGSQQIGDCACCVEADDELRVGGGVGDCVGDGGVAGRTQRGGGRCAGEVGRRGGRGEDEQQRHRRYYHLQAAGKRRHGARARWSPR